MKTIEQQVNVLRAQGYNPIHLFGPVYLVRYKSTVRSKLPLYFIKILKITS